MCARYRANQVLPPSLVRSNTVPARVVIRDGISAGQATSVKVVYERLRAILVCEPQAACSMAITSSTVSLESTSMTLRRALARDSALM